MPIEPVIVVGSAQISSDAVEIQYPPEAATEPIETTTGLPACAPAPARDGSTPRRRRCPRAVHAQDDRP